MVYQNILEKAALPAADCYIVTSVMEVGTSIRQIMDFDGQMHVPDNLVPVYVCRNPDDCDLDDMQQFFARPRFLHRNGVTYMINWITGTMPFHICQIRKRRSCVCTRTHT